MHRHDVPSPPPALGRVYTGPSEDVLYPIVQPGSVDLLHTDIPYNLATSSVDTSKQTVNGKATRVTLGGAGTYDVATYDYRAHVEGWVPLMAESGMIVVWCSDEQLSPLKAALAPHAVRTQTLVWHVTNPTPSLRKVSLLSAAQFAVIAFMAGPCRLTENWPGMAEVGHNVWRGPKPNTDRRILIVPGEDGESTVLGQKPQWLAVKAAKLFGLPGGLCMDPCAGSGALLVGAQTCGMRVIGAEQRPWWAKEANRWLKRSKTSSVLATVNASPTSPRRPLGPPGSTY